MGESPDGLSVYEAAGHFQYQECTVVSKAAGMGNQKWDS